MDAWETCSVVEPVSVPFTRNQSALPLTMSTSITASPPPAKVPSDWPGVPIVTAFAAPSSRLSQEPLASVMAVSAVIAPWIVTLAFDSILMVSHPLTAFAVPTAPLISRRSTPVPPSSLSLVKLPSTCRLSVPPPRDTVPSSLEERLNSTVRLPPSDLMAPVEEESPTDAPELTTMLALEAERAATVLTYIAAFELAVPPVTEPETFMLKALLPLWSA